jgi:hypothetical protein
LVELLSGRTALQRLEGGAELVAVGAQLVASRARKIAPCRRLEGLLLERANPVVVRLRIAQRALGARESRARLTNALVARSTLGLGESRTQLVARGLARALCAASSARPARAEPARRRRVSSRTRIATIGR